MEMVDARSMLRDARVGTPEVFDSNGGKAGWRHLEICRHLAKMSMLSRWLPPKRLARERWTKPPDYHREVGTALSNVLSPASSVAAITRARTSLRGVGRLQISPSGFSSVRVNARRLPGVTTGLHDHLHRPRSPSIPMNVSSLQLRNTHATIRLITFNGTEEGRGGIEKAVLLATCDRGLLLPFFSSSFPAMAG